MKLTPEEIKNAIQEHESKIIELQEQLKKSSYITGFERVEEGTEYSYIDAEDGVSECPEIGSISDRLSFVCANYGSEKRMSLLEKMNRLQRLLYRFSAENGGDNIDWSDVLKEKYGIYYDYQEKKLGVFSCSYIKYVNQIFFISEDVAERALEKFRHLMEEIIKEQEEVKKYYLELNSKEKLTSSHKFELGRKFIVDGLEYEIYHIEETENGTEYHIEHGMGDDDKYSWDIHTESELEKIILRGSFDE